MGIIIGVIVTIADGGIVLIVGVNDGWWGFGADGDGGIGWVEEVRVIGWGIICVAVEVARLVDVDEWLILAAAIVFAATWIITTILFIRGSITIA